MMPRWLTRKPAAVLDVLAAHHAGFHIVLITDGVFDAHVRHDFKPPYFLFTASTARLRCGHCAIVPE